MNYILPLAGHWFGDLTVLSLAFYYFSVSL